MPIKINNGQSMVIVKKDNVEMNEVRVNNVLVHKRVIITFNGNNGTPSTQTQKRTYEVEQVTQPNTPTRLGYTFEGWYTSSSGGSKVTFPRTIPSNNTTYYAQWTANSTGTLKWQYQGKSSSPFCSCSGYNSIGTTCSSEGSTQVVCGVDIGRSGSCHTIICKA